MFGARHSVLFLGVLCLVSGAAATIAIAAPGHRASHTVHACRHINHRRCHKPRPGKRLRHKHKQAAPKSSLPRKPGATTPLTAPPAAVIPGSQTGAGGGASSSAGGGASSGSSGGGAVPAEAHAAPAGPAHVQVTAEDSSGYHFILSRTTVPAGEVVIEFVNHGQDEHNIHAVEPSAGTEAGGLGENALPGTHTDLTLDLHAGSYTLFCSLPGHEAKGMKATLTVE
jgi:plastocyanin